MKRRVPVVGSVRELVIRRPLDPVAKVEAVILAHPTVAFESVLNNIAGGRQVMLQSWRGSARGLDAVRREYVEHPPAYMERLEVVRSSRDALLIFSVEKARRRTDVGKLIERHLGTATTCRVRKGVDGAEWTILTQQERGIEPFLRALRKLEDSYVAIKGSPLEHYAVVSLTHDAREPPPGGGLSPIERRVLSNARALGYFEIPRRNGIGAVAKALKMPASTALLHLRRAVAKLVEGAGDHVE